jgi:hypothetical protein
VLAAVVAATGLGVGALELGNGATSGEGGSYATDSTAPAATDGPSQTSTSVPSTPPNSETPGIDQAAVAAAKKGTTPAFPATYTADGSQIVIRDGWRVTRQVTDPMSGTGWAKSTGLVATNGTKTKWMLLLWGEATTPGYTGNGILADDAGTGFAEFDDWLADQVTLQSGSGSAPLVKVDKTDTPQPGTGSVIVAVRDLPVVDGYSQVGDRMVQVENSNRTYFATLRGHGTSTDVSPVDANLLAEPTFDAFVDYVRQRVRSGEGLK